MTSKVIKMRCAEGPRATGIVANAAEISRFGGSKAGIRAAGFCVDREDEKAGRIWQSIRFRIVAA